MEHLRIAALQTCPVHGDVAENADRLLTVISQTDAHCIVAPELALSGYVFASREHLRPLALKADNEYFQRFITVLKQKDSYLVLGFAEADGDNIYNSAALLGPEGIVSVYRKTHLFYNEKNLFDAGDTGFSVHETNRGLRIGMMICFDWVFPESARSLALLDADVIAHPSNLVLPYCQQSMPTRALENRVYTVTANRIGTEGTGEQELNFTGGSIIVGPRATVLAEAAVDAPCVISAEIDMSASRDKWMTPENHLLGDRRTKLYNL